MVTMMLTTTKACAYQLVVLSVAFSMPLATTGFRSPSHNHHHHHVQHYQQPRIGTALTAIAPQSTHPSHNTVAASPKDKNTLWRALQQTSCALALSVAILVQPVIAADFADTDISGRDFTGQDLAGKDFTRVKAVGTIFAKANLQGATFSAADLRKADFTGANLQSAKLDAVLDGAILKDVTAQRATFSDSILDIADLENADLSDSLWPSKLRIMICDMDELKGTNQKTGIETKESLMCTDFNFKS